MPKSVDSDEQQGPKSSYEVYRAEGDALLLHKHYKEGIDMFDIALELKPDDPYVLVQRSACYLALGEADKALKDAEKALEPDVKYYRAVYQKAEVLFYLGHFERALVFYHRGNRIRPQFEGFRLGIQKAEESINNCIGSKFITN
ncbi:Tetratricopeptide repeat protein 25 [Cichlidogyrus casuarinus]|uniref:Outer dynein arm-docking complex subunit 4 n=1 Tax=Cichlidogyrus casuarinus TaxID=1844966 RepID=A0ABD2QCL1_9PLAT